MITFSCPVCLKKLSVQDTLAGKKAKCPGCGQPVGIPTKVEATLPVEDMRTLPPSPGRQNDPSPRDASDARTHPPSSNPDVTHGANDADSGRDSSLTDFLAPAQSPDELGRLGKYRILAILGHGGMGVVYRAEDPGLERSVALKAMLPTLAASASAGKRFRREAKAMAAVEHDHIVRVYQVDEERGVPYLAMEFLKGEPLDERIRREEKMPLSEVLRIGREVADALAAAHATGLIHRDIKPANIWLEAPRNRVKILDFGLARAASGDSDLTQQGAIIGTPAYMPPEQGRGDPVDARGDLFSLGVVLYRLCTGQQPFKGKDTISTLMEVATHEPPPPRQLNPEVPGKLSDLVMQLLEKDPAQRPASAGEVVEILQTLERTLEGRGESLDDTALVQPIRSRLTGTSPRRRGRMPLVIGALFLLAGLIGLGVWALIHFRENHADYVVATDDPDFSFQVSKATVTLSDRKTGRTYDLNVVRQDRATGEHELEMTDADTALAFKTKSITIKRGETVALGAWFERKPRVIAKESLLPIDEAWLKKVRDMPAEKQVEAVVDKLKERNPGFDGEVSPKYKDGVVTELHFQTKHVADISPVVALTELQWLDVTGPKSKGKLADLAPLKGMKLTKLNCGNTRVSDLTPLKDMKLTVLHIRGSNVADLTPLKGMKLTNLFCSNTRVTDLSPLKDVPLKTLHCDFDPDRDSGILQTITTLEKINGTPVGAFWKDVDVSNEARILLNRDNPRHKQFLNIVASGKGKVIFLGDSITQGWESSGKNVWAEHFAPLEAVNLGIAGDQTGHVLWRITEGKELAPINPRAAVVMIGTNNIGRHSHEQIARGIKGIVQELRKQKPGMKILLLGIFPRSEYASDKIRDKIKATNTIISEFADGKIVFYKDIGYKFLDTDGSLDSELMPDFLHLNKKGYEIWARAIKDDLQKMLK